VIDYCDQRVERLGLLLGSLFGDGRLCVNALRIYEMPYPAVRAIKDYLAFYSDRVDAIEEQQENCFTFRAVGCVDSAFGSDAPKTKS
jgi:hypothetical protein